MEKPFRIISFFGGIDNLLRFFKEDDKIFYPAALSRRVRADQISLSVPLLAVDGFREETIRAPIRIVGGRAGALRPWLFSAISQSRSAGRPVVLFVPEQYTLQAERDLLTGMRLPGLLSLDVVSPTKLKTLVREAAGSSGRRALDEGGRAMALHQALQARSADLTFYRNLGEMYGAVSRMEQTLSELREEGFTPDSLRELAQGSRSGARRAKFHDLSLILETYDRLLQDRFDDPAAAWTDLCARLGASGIWAGVDLYVYGFDTLRPDLRQLMLAAVNCCAEISVLLTMAEEMEPAGRIFRVQRESAAKLSAALEEQGKACSLRFLPTPRDGAEPALAALERSLFAEGSAPFTGDPAPAVSLHAAPHPTGEAFTIVSVLRAWHTEGIPWNRMAIALHSGDASASTLTAVLRMNQIPFFYSRKEPIARHGVSRLLSAALECVSQGLRTEPLLEAACCGFGSLSREEGARLTRYVTLHGNDRNRWRKPFTRGEDAEEMEALRQRLLAPILRLHDALRGARDAAGSVEAVFRFLQEEEVHAQLAARQQRLMTEELFAEAVVDRQVWDALMNLLDQLWALLGGRKATLKEIALLVTGALERSMLSSLPEDEEGVSIGEIGHMLPGRTDALILPGMNDGIMAPGAGGLLSDPERREIEDRTGKAPGMDQARMAMMIRSDYYRTLTLPRKRLWVSFRLRDESGSALLPGEPVAELRRIFPALRQSGGLLEEIPYPETPALAMAGLGDQLRSVADGTRPDLDPEWQAALRTLWRRPDTSAALREMLAPCLGPAEPRHISPETALRLFHGERVSISRLECYAGCPYKHFLRYGLRPVVQDAYTFSAADAGDFFHQALDRYIRAAVREPAWPALPEERVSRIMDAILSRLTEEWAESPLNADALSRWQGDEYLRRVRHAASTLTRFAANSDFEIVGTEIAFGEAEGLPPLVLTLSDGSRVALRGKIDRLDRFDGPDGRYLRVLDLKSSEKNLEPAKMLTGEQLQLMIYLRAALRNEPGARPAGALYFPIQDAEVPAKDPEEAETLRLKELQLRGVVSREEDVLHAMDRDLSPFSLPKVLNQDGSLSKSARWVLEEKTLLALTDAAVRRAAALCEQIRSGVIPASPSVESDRSSACTFCEFSALCPKRKEDERPLPKGITFANAAAEEANNPLRNPEK